MWTGRMECLLMGGLSGTFFHPLYPPPFSLSLDAVPTYIYFCFSLSNRSSPAGGDFAGRSAEETARDIQEAERASAITSGAVPVSEYVYPSPPLFSLFLPDVH
jgi:hypothetical protein